MKSHLQSEKITFVQRRSHSANYRDDWQTRTPAHYHLEQKRAPVAFLDRKISETKEALRAAAGGSHLAFLLYRQPKWLQLMRNAQTVALFRQMRELQERRCRLFAEYRATQRHLFGPYATYSVKRRVVTSTQAVAQMQTVQRHAPHATISVKAPRRRGRHF